MPSPSTLAVYDLIAAHATAYARFEACCDPADPMAAKNRGEQVTPEAQLENEVAGDAEISTFRQLLSHVPTNIVELRRQVGYVQFLLECRDALDREELALLLNSLMAFNPHRYTA